MNRLIARDERETSVDQRADRISYVVLAFGVLAVVAWRGFVDRAASWELLGLVVLAGAAGAAYRTRERVVSRGWLAVIALAAVVGLAVAAVVELGLPEW